jgi:hypothetical protein
VHRRRQAEINILVDPDQAKVTAMVQSGKADAMLVDLPRPSPPSRPPAA